jgi:hypothetical protein
MSKLPNKASELIRVALADLKKAEASSDYVVSMSIWHEAPSFGIRACAVCFAGSVMAMTLEVPKHLNVSFGSEEFTNDGMKITFDFFGAFDVSQSDQNKLYALNEFRSGNVFYGMQALLPKKEWTENEELLRDMDRAVIRYESAPETFHNEMSDLAHDLEKLGY